MRFKYAKCVGMSPLPPKRTLGTTVGMSTLCQFQPLAILHSYACCRIREKCPPNVRCPQERIGGVTLAVGYPDIAI